MMILPFSYLRDINSANNSEPCLSKALLATSSMMSKEGRVYIPKFLMEKYHLTKKDIVMEAVGLLERKILENNEVV